jgi:hypothetical protein
MATARVRLACRQCGFAVAPAWRRCPDCGATVGPWWRRITARLTRDGAPALVAQEVAAAERQATLVAKQAELDGLRRDLAERRTAAAAGKRDPALLDRAVAVVDGALAEARRAEQRYRDVEAEVAVARERFRLAALADAVEEHLAAPPAAPEPVRHVGLAAGVHAFAPGAALLARSSYRTLAVEVVGARARTAWQVALDRPVSALAFDPTGRRLAVALAAQPDQVDARVLLYEAATGHRVGEVSTRGTADAYGRIGSLAFTASGLAAVLVPVHGRFEPSLRLWSLAGAALASQPLRVLAGRMVASADGSRLAVADGVGGIVLYRDGDLLRLREVHAPSATPLAFVDRDARLLFSHAGDRDDLLAVTDVDRPDRIREVARGGDRLAASPDGSVVATWAYDRMSVHCARTWHRLAEIRWPGPVRAAAVSEDGRSLLAVVEQPARKDERHDYLMRWEWSRGRGEGLSCELRHTARRARGSAGAVRDGDTFLREAVALGALVVRRRAAALDPGDPADDRRTELVLADAIAARAAGAGPVPAEVTRLLDGLAASVLATRLASLGRVVADATAAPGDQARARLERCEAALRHTAEWAGHRELARSPVAAAVRQAAEQSLGLVQGLIDHAYVARVPAALGEADTVGDAAHAERLRLEVHSLVEDLGERAEAALEVDALVAGDGDLAAALTAAAFARSDLLEELDREAGRQADQLAALRDVERLLTSG